MMRKSAYYPKYGQVLTKQNISNFHYEFPLFHVYGLSLTAAPRKHFRIPLPWFPSSLLVTTRRGPKTLFLTDGYPQI